MKLDNLVKLCIFVSMLFVVTNAQTDTVGFSPFLSSITRPNLEILQLEKINTTEQLNAYLEKVSLSLSEQTGPNFDSVTIIATYLVCGTPEFEFFYDFKQILNYPDSMVFEVVVSSKEIINQGEVPLIAQPAFNVFMFTIKKTDKNISLRKVPVNAIRKKSVERKNLSLKSKAVNNITCDIQGRFINENNCAVGAKIKANNIGSINKVLILK